MFDNIGGKIKKLAEVLCWLGIIASVLVALYIWIQAGKIDTDYGSYAREAKNKLILSGFIYGAVGALLSWVGSFTLYGFGHLVENSEITAMRGIDSDMKNDLQNVTVALRDLSSEIDAMRAQSFQMQSSGQNYSANPFPNAPVNPAAPAAPANPFFANTPAAPVAPAANPFFANAPANPTPQPAPSSGYCQLCGKPNVKLQRVKMATASGTVERDVCVDCYKRGVASRQMQRE